jgi:uncharacterized membrane protein YhhN
VGIAAQTIKKHRIMLHNHDATKVIEITKTFPSKQLAPSQPSLLIVIAMFSTSALIFPPTPAVYLLLVSLPLLVLSESSSFYTGHVIFKILSSSAFLGGPLVSSEKSIYHLLVAAGLVFSSVGDICLIPSRTEYYQSSAPAFEGQRVSGAPREAPKQEIISTAFKLGVLAFAVAHICYILAFLQNSDEISLSLLAGTFGASVLAANYLGAIYPTPKSSSWSNILNLSISGEMRPLVSIYVVIISSMVAVSVATTVPAANLPPQRLLGAGMFVISDAFVANDVFGKSNIPIGTKKADIRRQSWPKMALGWGLYFWGQMILAGTVYA